MFRGAYLPFKFHNIAPLVNYSLYPKKRSQIFVVGVGKKIKQFLKFLYLFLLARRKSNVKVYPKGVWQPPENGQNPYF